MSLKKSKLTNQILELYFSVRLSQVELWEYTMYAKEEDIKKETEADELLINYLIVGKLVIFLYNSWQSQAVDSSKPNELLIH